MAIHPRQFGIVLKNARMDKKLTQAELAEILDISLPYLKDLERFRGLSTSSLISASLFSISFILSFITLPPLKF